MHLQQLPLGSTLYGILTPLGLIRDTWMEALAQPRRKKPVMVLMSILTGQFCCSCWSGDCVSENWMLWMNCLSRSKWGYIVLIFIPQIGAINPAGCLIISLIYTLAVYLQIDSVKRCPNMPKTSWMAGQCCRRKSLPDWPVGGIYEISTPNQLKCPNMQPSGDCKVNLT